MNKNRLSLIVGLSVFALIAFKANKPEISRITEEESSLEASSFEDEIIQEKTPATLVDVEETPLKLLSEEDANVELFTNPDFVIYKNISEKVVRSAEEHESFDELLKNRQLLNDAALYLTSVNQRPTHTELINHLKVSKFLIDALEANSKNTNVLASINKVLSINLSEVKEALAPDTYKVIKADKAEIMYHALALNSDLQQNYSVASDDVESAKVYSNVQALYLKNIKVSKQMIADSNN